MWLLHVTGPVGEAPLTFWLPCGTFVVGRKEGKCDILVVNMTVSRQHGLFVVQPAAQSTAMASLSFADSSAAGTKVNGEVIKSSTAQLHSGSTLTIGSHHVIRLEACQNRASLHTPLPDASGYAAAPDLASVDGSAAVMTAGSATARSVSLAGRTCILTDSADKDPDLAMAVKLSGGSAVAVSAAGPELSRREGAFMVLHDEASAERDRAALPAHLRRLPYTTAPLLAAAIISGNPAVLAAILRTADTAEPPIVGAERHAATPRRNTRSQVDAADDAGEVPPVRASAAAPDQSAPPSGGKTRKRQAAGDTLDQRPAKRRPTRRVSDIPSQGSPIVEEAADEAADVVAGGTDAGDHTEEGSSPPMHDAMETSVGTSAAAEEALPKQPPLTAKRKRAVSQAAVARAGSEEHLPSAPTGEVATAAAQTAAAGGVSAAETRRTPAAQLSSQSVWRQHKHKQHALHTAATQQPAPTVKAKATNGRRAPKGRAMSASSQTAAQLDQDLDGGPDRTDSHGPGAAQMEAAQEPEWAVVMGSAVTEDLLVKVHAPLADPVPTPPQWAGVANYKAFRKQRAAQFTSHLPSGEDVTSSGAADAEKHQKEESNRHKKARAAEELFTAKVGKPRKATAKR